MLSHPPYSLDFAPANLFISKIKNFDERDIGNIKISNFSPDIFHRGTF
jgi:hypothetical protein